MRELERRGRHKHALGTPKLGLTQTPISLRRGRYRGGERADSVVSLT
jgi:hypothetical protein